MHLPVAAPLADAHQRRVSYVRISLTDRCNYRCTYCMPEEGVALSPKSDVLTLEEIARIVGVLVRVGVRRVRLTGGEPTVRHGLVELVERLASLPLEDLSLTTNGHTLRELAVPLRRAGLRRLNISIDSLVEIVGAGQAVKLRDLSLAKIESRPLRGKPWEYLFYLDFLGRVDDPVSQKALGHLAELADLLRVLGSYPKGA